MRYSHSAQDGEDVNGVRSDPEDDDQAPPLLPNGRHSAEHKSRSASSSLHDRARVSHGHRPSSPAMQPGGVAAAAAANATANGQHLAASTAKDSFLNYFFGGNAALSTGAPSGSRRAALPDFADRGGGDDSRSGNPMAGRRGLEGSAAAFDMKSLDKHLEAVRFPRSCWSLRHQA